MHQPPAIELTLVHAEELPIRHDVISSVTGTRRTLELSPGKRVVARDDDFFEIDLVCDWLELGELWPGLLHHRDVGRSTPHDRAGWRNQDEVVGPLRHESIDVASECGGDVEPVEAFDRLNVSA
jgi:hypothetical protein